MLKKLRVNLKCNQSKQFGMPEIVRNRPEGIHTREEMSRFSCNRYRKDNLIRKQIEENITEITNISRNIKSYHVEIQRGNRRFSKHYPLLVQAQTFKKTIINYFNQINENK